MDYTQSDHYIVDVTTGHRRHDLLGAIPTEVSDKDINQPIWSLMELLNFVGLAPAQFDPTDANTYQLVRKAIQLMTGPSVGKMKNLVVSTTGNNASVSLSFDELVLGDGAGRYKTVRNQALVINTAGAVGQPLSLSTGALAASTWYAVIVWDNGASTTATIDPNVAAPTAPAGYAGGLWAKAGWIRTDSSGNKYPLGILTHDRSTKYRQVAGTNVSSLPLMANGTAGSSTSFVAVAVGGFVPPTTSKIHVSLAGIHSTSSNAVAPNGSYTFGAGTAISAPISNSTNASAVGLASSGQMMLESTNIYYYSDTSTSSLCCVGWEDKS